MPNPSFANRQFQNSRFQTQSLSTAKSPRLSRCPSWTCTRRSYLVSAPFCATSVTSQAERYLGLRLFRMETYLLPLLRLKSMLKMATRKSSTQGVVRLMLMSTNRSRSKCCLSQLLLWSRSKNLLNITSTPQSYCQATSNRFWKIKFHILTWTKTRT